MKQDQHSTGRHTCPPERWIYPIGLLLLLLFALSEMHLHALSSPPERSAPLRVLMLLSICLLLYLGGCLHASRTGNTRIRRRWLLLFFFLYIYLLLNFTLLDKGLGRDGDLYGGMEREEYLKLFVNLHPGKTIYEIYILGFLNGRVGPYNTILNLLGNLCILMPPAFFLPLFLPLMRRWYIFFPSVLLSAALVEGLQFFFMIGSCDVDDVILNVGGAMLFYLLLKLPPLSRAIRLLVGDMP